MKLSFLTRLERDDAEELIAPSEAAALCRVTRFTIRNWILRRKLKASSTAGGHHRILRSDLLAFMKENGIEGAPGTKNTPPFLYCWEYQRLKQTNGHECEKCLVFKEKVNACFLVVREFGSDKIRCRHACSDCVYFERYFPREKAVMDEAEKQAPEIPEGSSKTHETRREKRGMNGIISKGIQRSGHWVAALKNVVWKKKQNGIKH